VSFVSIPFDKAHKAKTTTQAVRFEVYKTVKRHLATIIFSAISLPCCLVSFVETAQADPSGPIDWPGLPTPGLGTLVTPGGWGRMTRLGNGDWLCVSTLFPAGTNSHLGIYISSDNCKTWTYVSNVTESGRDLDNGEVITLKNGHVLLTMRSIILDSSYHLPVYLSTDGGTSWIYISNIDSSEGTNVGGLWEPAFCLLPNGELAVFYSNETHPGYSQIISERISASDGASWGGEIWAVAQPGGGSLRPGMPRVCQMATGNFILVFELVGVGNANVCYNTSTDGISWPSNLGTHIPCQHAAPFITALPDGRLLVTSCENQVSYSDDFGATWQKTDPPAWEFGFDCDWPAIYFIGTNQVGVMVVNGPLWLAFGSLSPPINWPTYFVHSFASGTDANWTRYDGNFSFAGGDYWLDDTNSYGKALTGDEFWSDGVLQADVLVTTPGNAGLIFRATNPDYTGPDDGFDYYVGLDTGGSVVLGLQSNSYTPLTSASMTLTTNTWHHIMVNLQGSNITIYVDDLNHPRISWTDGTFTRGQIGVRAYECNAAFNNVTFSNAIPLDLRIQWLGNELSLAWPQTSHDLKLYSTSNLTSSTPWTLVTNAPSLFNGIWSTLIPKGFASKQFFRLVGQ
jgi:hypothetical protein